MLTGRVLDSAASPIAGARVEIWQCDVNRRYLHHGDPGGNTRDPAFQGFGHDLTGADGSLLVPHHKTRTLPGAHAAYTRQGIAR